jgi:cell division protein FtsX
MIRLALRLTVAGGREALTRLTAVVLAVAVGATLLLATLAGINAVGRQNARYAWLETSFTPDSRVRVAGVDPLWWQATSDTFDGKLLGRIDLAATGPHSPVPPGVAHLPGPGEFYASPALSRLLRTTPRAELGARFPGRQVGTIADAALPAPDSLIAVVGHLPQELAGTGLADEVTAISSTTPTDCNGCPVGVGINENGMILVLSVVALAILFPVLILIATATRLSAARREQRFAALRLVGASPRQVSVIAAVEAAVAALAGTVLALPAFLALRGPIAAIPFTGAPFFPGDLSLTALDVLLVVLGVPLASAFVARVALRRVRISPLGVTRRVTPKAPGAARLLPLAAGVAELGYFTAVGPPATTGRQTIAYVAGFALILIGLVIAGPWLTMVGARVVAARSRRPAGLLAGRRLADNPRAGFRAVTGLVLALFVTSVTVGVITTLVAAAGPSAGNAAGSTLVRDMVRVSDGHFADSVPSIPAGTRARLEAVEGVTGVTVIHRNPAFPPAGAARNVPPGLVQCAQLASTPAVGRCRPGAAVAGIDTGFGSGAGRRSTAAEQVWPAEVTPPAAVEALPVAAVVVQTNGTTAAVEAARTALELTFPGRYVPTTIAAASPDSGRLLQAYEQLANVVILVSLPIAGCSLAVAVAAGLLERRRPFSLLRLAGTPLATLRRVVAFETLVPLLLTAAASIGVGFLAAHLFLRAQLGQTLVPPGGEYYAIVGVGLLCALLILGCTLPLLARITGPEAARTD